MACTRRTITSSFTHLSRRFHPSFAHILRDDRDDRDGGEPPSRPPPPPGVPSPPRAPFVSQSIPNFSSALRDGRRLGLSLSLGQDPFHPRFYSSGFEGGSSEIEIIKDVAEVLTAAATVSAVPAPFPGEVAAAAADSFLPVAALQYLIDGVHSFSGLNWWASIAMTTILIRVAMTPLLLNPLRALFKYNVIRPELEELERQIENSMDPKFIQECQKRMKALYQKHGVTLYTPLKQLFITVPVFISFFLAISNMVEKVPSFKGGGAFWFTDLTTPDPLYMLPVLTSLTILANVELKMLKFSDEDRMATMKNFPRVIVLMVIPFTADFPKAIFCHWITSNIFSLACRFVIKHHPPVRKFLDLPDIVPHPTKPAPQPNFSFFGGSKPIEPTTPSSLDEESKQLKPPERRVSSSSVISQRIRNLEKTIRNLEKTVKARSKPKKR